MRHPLRETSYVKPFESGATLGVKDLQREIMLFSDVNGNFAIVGPFTQTTPLPPVIVPVYPEENDMILVKGDDGEIWHAQVRHVLCAIKLVIFLHLTSKLWVRA